jgi:integrase
MSIPSASQRPLPATLGEVAAAIQARGDLQDRVRRDLACAIRTLCRALGQTPADVLADPALLRRRMKDLSAPAVGLAGGSWRNAKSRVNKATALAGIAPANGRARTPLSPEWKRLLSRVPAPEMKYRLSRLARYCSGLGLGPTAVSDEVMAGFANSLFKNVLVGRPKQVHRTACLAWNVCADSAPGWPRKLTVPDNRRDYSLDWETFPEPFRCDVEAYLDHLAGNDLLADTATHPASPVTLKFRRIQLRQMASALVYSDRKPDSISSLADLVAVDAAKAILSHFLRRSGQRKTGQIHNLALLLVSIGRHWIGVPPEQLEQLQRLRRNVDPGKKGLTDKSRARLRQFEDEENVARLVQLPRRLAEEIRGRDRGGVSEALSMQNAVALAVLLVAPIRVKNLTSINMEYHISRSRPGGMVHLVIPAHEVKNGVDLEFELPPDVVAILDRYIEKYRPRLVNGPSPWLFPAKSGGAKPPGAFGVQLSKAVKKATGLIVNVHLFRHLAAQLILEANPGAYELVRLLLGHRSAATTTLSYCGTEQKAASRYYDSLIGQYRKSEGGSHGRK